MVILYLGAFRFPAQDAGAIRVYNNAKIFRQLGHRVYFYSWGGEGQKTDLQIDGKYYYDGFEYWNTAELRSGKVNLLRKVLWFFNRGKKTMKLLSNSPTPDIVIAYNTTALFNQKCLRFCVKNNIKFISDLTEWYDVNEMGGYFSFTYWLNEWNMKHFQKRVSNKIVISSFLAKYYKSNNIVIPSLTDIRIISPFKKDIYEGELKDGYVKIIYAGTPTKKDKLATMIKAFINVWSQNNNIVFHILGVDNFEQVEDLDMDSKKWLKNNCGKDIFFKGKIPHEMVPFYYQQSDCSMVIRKKNRKNMAGFPTKAAESLASGCPVLFNDTSDLSLYLKDGINAIQIENDATQSVEKGLIRLLSLTKEERIDLKKRAYTSAEKLDYRSFISRVDNWLHALT